MQDAKVQTVTINGNVYVRKEDVVKLITEFVATEINYIKTWSDRLAASINTLTPTE